MDNKTIENSIEENHHKAFIIIYYFFSTLDLILIFVVFYISKFYFNPIKTLFVFFVLDVLKRFSEIFTYSIKDNICKEIFISILETSEFCLIISFINKAFINSDNYINKNVIGYFIYFLLIIIFFAIIFPFEKFFINYYFSLCFLKYLVAFLCMFLLFKFIMKRFKEFVDNIAYKMKLNLFLLSILSNMPGITYFLYTFKYLMYLMTLLLKDKLYISYMKMAAISINESAKYSIIVFLIGLLYVYESNPDFNTKEEVYKVTVNQNLD